MSDLWGYDDDGSRYAEITEDEINKTVKRFQELDDELNAAAKIIGNQAKEIERLEADVRAAYLEGYEVAHGFDLTDRERERLISMRYG